MRIILISPYPAERTALQQLLAEDGHHVAAVPTRPEGLELAAKGRVDAIIADAQVIGLDGVALMRELSDRGVQVPVILLCPRASHVLKKDGVACLTKPIDLIQLRRHIARPRTIESHAL
jgi:DNA-binding response OmpR family regulator